MTGESVVHVVYGFRPCGLNKAYGGLKEVSPVDSALVRDLQLQWRHDFLRVNDAMLEVTMVVGLLLLVTVSAYYFITRHRSPDSKMPGPRGLPFVGSTLSIDARRPHVTFSKWARRYGTIYKVETMGQHLVFLNDYKSISEALLKSGNTFNGRPDTFCIRYISEGRRGIAFADPDKTWAAVRKAVHGTLKVQSRSWKETMEELDDNLMARFQKRNGEPFLAWSDLYNYSLQSVYRFVLGEVVEYGDKRFALIKEYETLGQNVMGGLAGRQLDAFPWLRWLGHRAHQTLQRMDDIANQLWASHKDAFEDDSQTSVMHELVKSQKNLVNKDGEPVIDPISVKKTFIGLFMGGISTGATTMYAMIHVLAYHPEIQTRIRQEINAELEGRRPSLEHQAWMPYTRAFVLEVLRNVTPTPLALPHTAIGDGKLLGYDIPKGTTLIMNLWHLHHDDAFWEEPFQFHPERYLDADGQLVAPDHPRMKRTLPFSAGGRSCPGEVFSLPRLFLFVSSLVQQFNVEPVPGQKCPCDPRTYRTGMVLRPEDCLSRLVPLLS